MFFSGIADEAGPGIDAQIRAQKELGWSHVELRTVDGKQFTQVTDEEFNAIRQKLDKAGIRVSSFASAIANWARPVTNPFDADLADLKRAIPRMKKLGCPFLRVMSWPNNCLAQDAWKAETVRRMKELARIAEDGGVTLVLENCDGWAAQSSKHMIEFLASVDSPALRVVFDTGNPPFHHYDGLEMYTVVKPHVAYIHIKDSYVDSDGGVHYAFPNEGHGYVRQILTDALRGGYEGGISIEPHLAAVIHEGKAADTEGAAYKLYVEYGRRLQKLVEGILEKL
ncbi:MAG: sugar phosphate isomerase/epimerase family protein [Planctomycetota bacterium]